MRFQDNIPIYVQIANDLKEQIISGKLQDGDKLGSLREYSVEYEVTTLTMQRTFNLLESEGIIQTKKGIGSFVVLGVQSSLENKVVNLQVEEFLTRMKNMGVSEEDILTIVKERLKNG
jgi:Predicted transcriptional regulators